jgi:hypothetical protein
MTILAILLAALLGGVNAFTLHGTGVGNGGSSTARHGSPAIGGGVTVNDVLGGGPVG